MSKFKDLQIRQLDEALTPFRVLRQHPPPRQGWVRTIREALGMSLRQLAERTGSSKTAVKSVETNEARGTIQLDSLQKLAEAMECEVVYALVPRSTLSQMIGQRARRKAESLVERVSESMELEAQGIPAAERHRQIEEIVADILRDRRRDFWDV
jgi:predicted DNA-binding mobile mystery protein A